MPCLDPYAERESLAAERAELAMLRAVVCGVLRARPTVLLGNIDWAEVGVDDIFAFWIGGPVVSTAGAQRFVWVSITSNNEDLGGQGGWHKLDYDTLATISTQTTPGPPAAPNPCASGVGSYLFGPPVLNDVSYTPPNPSYTWRNMWKTSEGNTDPTGDSVHYYYAGWQSVAGTFYAGGDSLAPPSKLRVYRTTCMK